MNTACRVFFSYAWRDLGLAMRIDADLRRSGVGGIWRDRIDGQVSGNFREEYRERIRQCEVFLLLDSPNYRHRSNYCRDELAFFLECCRRQPEKRLVVCLAEAPGAWRDEELFDRQRECLYVQFGVTGAYDNLGTYNTAMRTLCAAFGAGFVPWPRELFEQDFLDELQRSAGLDEPVRQRLLEDYHALDFYLLRNLPTVEGRMRNLIADCDFFGLKVQFPSIFLCEWLLNHQRMQECIGVLGVMKGRCPEDARVFLWSATASFRSGDTHAALAEYLRAEALAAASGEVSQYKYLNNIRLNILYALVRLERFSEAMARAADFRHECPETDWNDWMYYSYVAQAYLFAGDHSDGVRRLLARGLERFPAEASLYALAGFCDFMAARVPSSVAMYGEAVRCAGSVDDMLEYASHLAAVLLRAGRRQELETLKAACLALSTDTGELGDSARRHLAAILATG